MLKFLLIKYATVSGMVGKTHSINIFFIQTKLDITILPAHKTLIIIQFGFHFTPLGGQKISQSCFVSSKIFS
jgi:hypothetical protein